MKKNTQINKKIKTLIFGGTFDPIHLGHLITANTLSSILKYERVIFIPSKIPPHKKISGEIKDTDRLSMIKLAIEKNKNFSVEEYELKSNKVSYTIDTLKYIYENYKDIKGKLGLLIGSDLIEDFHKWRDPEKISSLSNIICVNRSEDIKEVDKKYFENIKKYKIKTVTAPRFDISSSLIRENIKKNISVRYYLPDLVYEYIEKNSLYRTKLK